MLHLCTGELSKYSYKWRLASQAGISKWWYCGYSQSECYSSCDLPVTGSQLGIWTRGFFYHTSVVWKLLR